MVTTTTTQILGGRYVLEEVLGTGDTATVWRAADEVLGREVAVKVLSPQYAADAGFMARFEQEARNAAQLSHPRLAKVFDCGIDHGTAFVVMELVAGRTLRQILDDAGILLPGRAVRIAAAVCEALEVAHAAGLVHRDIKPANIVVSGGEVKVLDFGIVRADSSADGTPALGALGTVAYLSPEQASGGPVGPQSDLYSLGCVLFEMLTGEPPSTADSAVGVPGRHARRNPGQASARQPGLPVQLDGITTRLLAKDPAARPASAAVARADLLAALNPGAKPLFTTRRVVPSGLSRRRFRGLTWAEVVLAGALAAALVAVVAMMLSGTTGHAVPRAAPNLSLGAIHHSSASRRAADKAHQPANVLHAPKRLARPAPRLSALPRPKLSARPRPKRPRVRPVNALPPVAATAATFVGDLEAGVIDRQVAPPAGGDLYNHLKQLLFSPPGQTPQQIQQQYAQILQSYDHDRQQGQITGHAAIALHRDLRALAAAVGAA